MTWYIIQTNPNCETKAVAEIRRAGFRAYHPKAARGYVHHRTKRPEIKRGTAFVGWIFMRFPDDVMNFPALRSCHGVRGILMCDGQYYRMPRASIAAIMRAQRRMEFDDANARTMRRAAITGERHALTRARLRPGMSVLNAANGILAEVLRVTHRGTVEAITDMMGKATPVEFSDPDKLVVLAESLEAA